MSKADIYDKLLDRLAYKGCGKEYRSGVKAVIKYLSDFMNSDELKEFHNFVKDEQNG